MSLGSYYEKAAPIIDESRWLRTGLFCFDLLCGWGLPKSSVVQLYGLTQSRKTTAAMILLQAAQRAGYACFWFDVEGGFLDHVAMLLGVSFDEPKFGGKKGKVGGWFGGKNKKTQVVKKPGLLIEDGTEISTIEQLFEEAERACKACQRGGLRPFFVIDSMTRLTTDLEEKHSYDNDTPMTQARSLRRGYRLFLKHLKAADGIFVVIDHLKPTGTAGAGSATGFFASTCLEFKLLHEERDGKEPVSFEALIASTKARNAPKIEAPLSFHYETGVDLAADTFFGLVELGILELAGSWYKLPKRFPGKARKFQGKEKWAAFYNRHVAKHREWIELEVALCMHRRFHRLCESGDIDPYEHLAKFGADTLKRARAQERRIEKKLGVKVQKKSRKKKKVDDELADLFKEKEKEK